MKRKYWLIPLLIIPVLSGCKNSENKGDFYIGNSENRIIELTNSELSAKFKTEMGTFFLATHQGYSCTCWTGFQFVMQEYNDTRKENTYIPFFGFDTDLLEDDSLGIDKVTSGYVEFYLIVDGKIEKKYSKSAKKDFDMFENTEKFREVIKKHINTNPINNYAYISYENAKNLINDSKNDGFVLFTIRSGCGDCSYSVPKVLTPWLKENGTKIPVFVCDIEKYRGTDQYTTVKDELNLSTVNSLEFGYGTGVVPTYQYYKNGSLVDAGVYANDSFKYENDKLVVSSYFDGTRNLKYTNKNLKAEMEASNELTSQLAKVGDQVYLPTEKEAAYHDSIFKDFLSYYCK